MPPISVKPPNGTPRSSGSEQNSTKPCRKPERFAAVNEPTSDGGQPLRAAGRRRTGRPRSAPGSAPASTAKKDSITPPTAYQPPRTHRPLVTGRARNIASSKAGAAAEQRQPEHPAAPADQATRRARRHGDEGAAQALAVQGGGQQAASASTGVRASPASISAESARGAPIADGQGLDGVAGQPPDPVGAGDQAGDPDRRAAPPAPPRSRRRRSPLPRAATHPGRATAGTAPPSRVAPVPAMPS